jgi:hypothetical protein
VEDTTTLSRWAQRQVAIGMARRPDLVELVASIADPDAARTQISDAVEQAATAAGGGLAATIGTARHELCHRAVRGDPLDGITGPGLDTVHTVQRLLGGLHAVESEILTVCDSATAAGTADLVVQVADQHQLVAPDDTVYGPGSVLIADLKTGRASSRGYWGPAYSAQLAVYARGVPYRHTPDLGWHRGRWDTPPDTVWGLILHVPQDDPTHGVMLWVDLLSGWAAVRAAMEVRTVRGMPHMRGEATVTTTTPDPDAPPDIPALIAAAADEEQLLQVWHTHRERWCDQWTALVSTRLTQMAS